MKKFLSAMAVGAVLSSSRFMVLSNTTLMKPEALVAGGPHRILYGTILLLQAVFYGCALQGYRLSQRKIKNKLLFVPYYFLFMNLNVLRGIAYLRRRRGQQTGAWEKAKRAA